MVLHLDFETYSEAELSGEKSVGLWNYFNHKSTALLMMAYAFDEGEVKIWFPTEPMPAPLRTAFDNPRVQIAAFNSAFERYALQYKLATTIPASRFEDPQPSARYLSLPGNLDECSEILGLPQDMAKDKEGKRLINLFCKPVRLKKKRGQPQEWGRNDATTHPADWALFVSYCKQDVVAEREVMRRQTVLGVYPLPRLERRIWEMDQKIDDHGIPVDRDFVTKALKLALREKEETILLNNERTGLENSNSPAQMLAWARARGYDRSSLQKDTVKAQLKYNDKLTPLCRQVLESRAMASSTSYTKLSAILRQICDDDRIRNQFQFMGSARCGRWTGGAVQFHNLAKPNDVFEIPENVDKARAMIYAEDYDGLKKAFGSVLLTIKFNIRTCFVTPDRFNVCDLNAIETRVGAWVAGCQSLLDVFDKIKYPPIGRDPYLHFAVNLTQIPYEVLARDIKSKDPETKARAKQARQWAKPGVLGCIYRLGGGQMGTTPKKKNKKGEETGGDPKKFGLWGYAENMGIEMTMEKAHEIVRVFRNSYPEICKTWFNLEEAIRDVLGGTQTVRFVGPNDCIKIDKAVVSCNDYYRTILRIHLPSGRKLHYMDASVEDTKMPWQDSDGEDVYKPTLCYAGQDQKTKQWSVVTSHGGKVFENIVQGMARDVLAVKLLAFEDEGLPVVAHVHDEGVTETPDSLWEPGLLEMEEIMARPIAWAPGLPLASDGFEGSHYHK